MKKSKKLFGIAALAVVIGFTMTACSSPGGGGGDNNSSDPSNPGSNSGTPINGAATLKISGEQVYESDEDGNLTKFNVNVPISDGGIGGSGSISNGILSYSIETPNNLESINALFTEWNYWTDATFSASDPSAKYSLLEELLTQDGNTLVKGEFKESIKGNTYTTLEAYLVYIYVDKDVTITADAYSGTSMDGNKTFGTSVKAIKLALKAGWNTVFWLQEGTATSDYTTYNTTVSLSNPTSLRWMRVSYGSGSAGGGGAGGGGNGGNPSYGSGTYGDFAYSLCYRKSTSMATPIRRLRMQRGEAIGSITATQLSNTGTEAVTNE